MSEVEWYLVSDDEEAILATSTEFLDVWEAREHSGAQRITDNPPDDYDERHRPDDGEEGSLLQGL